MRKHRWTIIIAVLIAILGITTVAVAATTTVSLASGNDAHVTCGGSKMSRTINSPTDWTVRCRASTSPNPTPTSTSPSPPPSSTSSSPGTYACTTSSTTGRCGPYTYALVEGASSNPYVDQNVWGAISGETQTLHANSPGDWKVTNNTPTNPSGSVTGFPNTGAPFNEQALSSFPKIVGSFSESMPHTSGSSGWATYDNWFDNWKYEVMIQNDFVGNGPCDYVAVATFGGSNGVPSQLWGLCKYGSELIWKLAAPGSTVGTNQTVNESSGSVDIKAMIQWLVDHGYMTANPTITNLSYGFEICSTGGRPQDWSVNSYSLITH